MSDDLRARRASDQVWWRRVGRFFGRIWRRARARENAYRDVWLAIISGIVLWTAIVASGAAHNAEHASRAANVASHAAKAAAQQANDNVKMIQQSREDATRETCEAQNKRHDVTITRLNKLVAAIPDAARRAQARKNIGGTISLIEALAPKRDCAKVVRETVSIPAQP